MSRQTTARGEEMSRNADAVIIGAGVIGAAIAYELAQKGYKTLNIDNLPASVYGPTSASCAIVRAHYSSWDGVAMAYEGFFYWKDWADYLGVEDEAGLAKYMNCGTLLLESGTGHHQKVLKHYRDIGVEFEEWSTDQLRERMPIFDTHAFYPPKRPEDPHFWDQSDEQLPGAIYTPGSGDVNDAGPHSDIVNEMAGATEDMNVRTKPLRHEVHHVPAPPDFDYDSDGIHCSDGDTGIYFRPESGNHILIGSEDPDCDPRHWVEDPDKYDRHVTEAQWEAQVYRLARRIPSLRIPNERKGVVDLYDCSDDWIPVYDKSDVGGFYMAIGTSGNQFKNAPVVGHVMAELIDRVEHGHDHDAEPVKVPCRYTGLELDMGFYSRRREINPNSSFSVNG